VNAGSQVAEVSPDSGWYGAFYTPSTADRPACSGRMIKWISSTISPHPRVRALDGQGPVRAYDDRSMGTRRPTPDEIPQITSYRRPDDRARMPSTSPRELLGSVSVSWACALLERPSRARGHFRQGRPGLGFERELPDATS